MTWQKYVLLALVAAEGLSAVALIGRPRTPVTPGYAATVLALYTVAAVLVVTA